MVLLATVVWHGSLLRGQGEGGESRGSCQCKREQPRWQPLPCPLPLISWKSCPSQGPAHLGQSVVGAGPHDRQHSRPISSKGRGHQGPLNQSAVRGGLTAKRPWNQIYYLQAVPDLGRSLLMGRLFQSEELNPQFLDFKEMLWQPCHRCFQKCPLYGPQAMNVVNLPMGTSHISIKSHWKNTTASKGTSIRHPGHSELRLLLPDNKIVATPIKTRTAALLQFRQVNPNLNMRHQHSLTL